MTCRDSKAHVMNLSFVVQVGAGWWAQPHGATLCEPYRLTPG